MEVRFIESVPGELITELHGSLWLGRDIQEFCEAFANKINEDPTTFMRSSLILFDLAAVGNVHDQGMQALEAKALELAGMPKVHVGFANIPPRPADTFQARWNALRDQGVVLGKTRKEALDLLHAHSMANAG